MFLCYQYVILLAYACMYVSVYAQNPTVYLLALSTCLLNYLLLLWWRDLDWTTCRTLLNVYPIFTIPVAVSFLWCAFSSACCILIWGVFSWTVDLCVVLIFNKLVWNNLGRTKKKRKNSKRFFSYNMLIKISE